LVNISLAPPAAGAVRVEEAEGLDNRTSKLFQLIDTNQSIFHFSFDSSHLPICWMLSYDVPTEKWQMENDKWKMIRVSRRFATSARFLYDIAARLS
jgi:hypothetical protein